MYRVKYIYIYIYKKAASRSEQKKNLSIRKGKTFKSLRRFSLFSPVELLLKIITKRQEIKNNKKKKVEIKKKNRKKKVKFKKQEI